jgi:hypothetical protein
MNAWRQRLLVATVVGTTAGYGWLLATAEPRLRASMLVLSGIFLAAAASVLWVYRHQLTARVVTANLALGAIVHLVATGAVAAADHLWHLGLVPGLGRNWAYFLLGVLGVGGALFTWSRARPESAPPPGKRSVSRPATPEPAPAPSAHLDEEPRWVELARSFDERADATRARQLDALRRIAAVLGGDEDEPTRLEHATRVLRQEVLRLAAESAASHKSDDETDLLTQVAAFFEWGVQKLPEIADLDVEDLLLAQVVAEIRATHSEVEHVFVDHRALHPIHPIDRPSAEAKCAWRVGALQKARELLHANGMRLSEDFIAAHEELAPMASVTGFQVVSLGDGEGYVTFEGNGRAFALQRAFGMDAPLEVEVRQFRFRDDAALRRVLRHVERVRRANGILADSGPDSA